MGIITSILRTFGGGAASSPFAYQVPQPSPAVSPPSTPRFVYSDTGEPELLGQELARGGEGAVHQLANRPGILVKLYFKDRLANDTELPAKIHAMTALPLRDDPRFAWPRMTVHDDAGRFIGLAMRQVEGVSFQTFCQPRLVQQRLPRWDRRKTVQVAMGFVELIQTLHRYQVLVGDINPANFLFVPDTGAVSCLDCDSYQIRSSTGIYRCRVAVPEFQPPELQQGFSDVTRNPEHEKFSVAVLLFKVLMLGLHPYSHRDGGHPIENLQKGKTPFDPGSGRTDRVCFLDGNWRFMWSHLPFAIKTLFIRSFVDGHSNPTARPTLDEWSDVLWRYGDELKKGWHSDELMPTRTKDSSKPPASQNPSATPQSSAAPAWALSQPHLAPVRPQCPQPHNGRRHSWRQQHTT
jgi:DNA-binding helix-hairpin-helix protein with protein kinase domain